MLFAFGSSDRHGIWMKDMRFPIDIFWLDEYGQIVFIKKDAQPDSYPEVFLPNSPAKFVLEVTAGFAEENSLKIGDKISFKKN